jgi:ABC-2 type transport system ATP-binding protein
MTEAIISATQLTKTYRVAERGEGLRASVRHLFRPTFSEIHAVCELSFEIRAGEIIGLIGPNGAGKTSILKMLGGILYPTRGSVKVISFTPWERKPEFLRQISMVLGNKSQMIWDIPALDTLRVLGEIYHLSKAEYAAQIDLLVQMLDMKDLLKRPVRNLSLGERMKCELAAGLLHRPSILFLDEPTLGLDITTQNSLRKFIAEYNRETGATVILTSHYLGDITALCQRVLLLHEGRFIYDGELNGLAAQLAPYKLIHITLPVEDQDSVSNLPGEFEVIEQEETRFTIRIPRDRAAELTGWILKTLPVNDLSVEDPPLESVIDRIYRKGEV